MKSSSGKPLTRVDGFMRWKRVTILALGCVLVLLVASFVTLRMTDLNRFKPQIIQSVKEATGLDLVLRGDIRVGFAPGPILVLEDIAIRNADWGVSPDVIRIRRCELDFALLRLAKGVVQIEQMFLLECPGSPLQGVQVPAQQESGPTPAPRHPVVQLPIAIA